MSWRNQKWDEELYHWKMILMMIAILLMTLGFVSGFKTAMVVFKIL